jgi:predicted GIY-YIG superfamily endonuclease
MHYVYLLQSESFADQRYVGMASALKRRLSDHKQYLLNRKERTTGDRSDAYGRFSSVGGVASRN